MQIKKNKSGFGKKASEYVKIMKNLAKKYVDKSEYIY